MNGDGTGRLRGAQTTENKMDQNGQKKEIGRVQGEDFALMYPTNQLGDQVRDYDQTEGMGALFRREFFDKK